MKVAPQISKQSNDDYTNSWTGCRQPPDSVSLCPRILRTSKSGSCVGRWRLGTAFPPPPGPRNPSAPARNCYRRRETQASGSTPSVRGRVEFRRGPSRRATGVWATTPCDQYVHPSRATDGYGRIIQPRHVPHPRRRPRPVHDPRRTRPRRHGCRLHGPRPAPRPPGRYEASDPMRRRSGSDTDDGASGARQMRII